MSDSHYPQMDLSINGGPGWNPVHELMRAIVLRTVDDYASGGLEREEALEYMWDEDEEYIFSFRFICNHLGMDPDKTRSAIVNAKHRISTRRRAA